MKLLNRFLFFLFLIFFSGCVGTADSHENKPKSYGSYRENSMAMVDVHTFDHYSRRLQQGYGFYVSPHVVVAPLSLVKGSNRVKIAPLGTTQMFDVSGYTSYDLTNDLVTLHVQRKTSNYIPIDVGHPEGDTLYSLFRLSHQLMVRKTAIASEESLDFVAYTALSTQLETGKPAFYQNHSLAGIIMSGIHDDKTRTRVLNKVFVDSLLKKQHSYPQPILDLSGKTDKIYTSYKSIKGFRVVTDMGNVVLKLFDETPDYRDNFIKLVEDQFYDSLLVHRVLKNFLIQTGAADTRYATPEDVVGWQGPGYTLPMKIVPGLFHKRGAIAASKLPDERNPKNNSDGSQFYIVSGRVFTHQELDELENQKGIRFSTQQRRIYTSEGGAPHLDFDYTVFGEVVDGMDVVDAISQVPTHQTDRPVEDVRIVRVDIIRK